MRSFTRVPSGVKGAMGEAESGSQSCSGRAVKALHGSRQGPPASPQGLGQAEGHRTPPTPRIDPYGCAFHAFYFTDAPSRQGGLNLLVSATEQELGAPNDRTAHHTPSAALLPGDVHFNPLRRRRVCPPPYTLLILTFREHLLCVGSGKCWCGSPVPRLHAPTEADLSRATLLTAPTYLLTPRPGGRSHLLKWNNLLE